MLRSLWSCGVIVVSAASLVYTGCDGGRSEPKPGVKADGHDHAEHGSGDKDHPEEGPHHGHLIELGKEEYHAELAHDDSTNTVTIYLLDASAKNAVPITESEVILNLIANGSPLQAKLPATPQAGDPAGQSSRFSLVDEKVLEALEAKKTTGRLNITISGKSYTGELDHHEHGEHEHK